MADSAPPSPLLPPLPPSSSSPLPRPPLPLPPEELLTARLRLRTPTLADAPTLFERYTQDTEVVRYLPWAAHPDVETTRVFLQTALQQRATGTRAPWVIELRGAARILGMIDVGLAPPRASFGYVIARAEWGQGYATEAARAVVGWALSLSGIERVVALCDVENHASERVLEKAGLLREGLLRRTVVLANRDSLARDCLLFAAVRASPTPAASAEPAAGVPRVEPRVLLVDHVQLSLPPGGEAEARAFYAGVLGLRELPRPADMAARGGCWFGAGAVRLHFGVEQDFHPARKAHPALVVTGLAELLLRCEQAGARVTPAVPLDGVARAHVLDPFGNRLELIEAPER